MAEPDWAKILDHLYDNAGEIVVRQDVDVDEDTYGDDFGARDVQDQGLEKVLLNQIDVGTDQIDDILDHMNRVNLIQRTAKEGYAKISLTPKGFDVAHEREMNSRQNQTNMILAALTAGLFFTAAVQAIGAYYSVPQAEQVSMGIGTAVVGVLVIVILIVMIRQ